MTEPTMDAVLARLDSLEKQNRLFKRIGAGVLLLGLAIGGMAMAQEETVPEVVRARRVEVVDEVGGKSATLGYLQTGGFGLHLAGSATAPTPYATLSIDSSGLPGLRMSCTPDPALGIVTLGFAEPSAPMLTLLRGHAEAKTSLLHLGYLNQCQTLRMASSRSGNLVVLNAPFEQASGPPSLALTAKDGKTLFKVPE